MVKILYAVAKEGMGHAIRGRTIIEALSKKHKIKILAGGKPFDYLSQYFPNITKIHDFDLVYLNNSVNNTLTFFLNFIKAPFLMLYNIKSFVSIFKFKPDIMITDFEPFSNYFSYLTHTPLISIDNQHVVTKCKIDVPKKYKKDFLLSYFVINKITNNAKHYFITSFFSPKIKNKNASLIAPIIRKKILALKPRKKEHILVYQTSKSYKQLLAILKNIDEKFIIYGFNKSNKNKNLTFKKFNEDIFLKDLAECKTVITNGGFNLICEATYLKKPILSFPIKHQFEQILNALYLQKLGYGEFHERANETIINTFILNLNKYEKNLKKCKKEDNIEFLNELEKSIKRYSKR